MSTGKTASEERPPPLISFYLSLISLNLFLSLSLHHISSLPLSLFLTTVGVDAAVVQESDSQVVQNSRLVQEAESSEVFLPLQNIRVRQRGEARGWRHWVLHLLEGWHIKYLSLSNAYPRATNNTSTVCQLLTVCECVTLPSLICSTTFSSPRLQSLRSLADTHTASGSGTHTLAPCYRNKRYHKR